jgi:hypothetical protein
MGEDINAFVKFTEDRELTESANGLRFLFGFKHP